MDVLLNLTAAGHGGVESHSVALAAGLQDAGHTVSLMSQRRLDFDSDLRDRLAKCGAELIAPPLSAQASRYLGLVRARWTLARKLRRRPRFDVAVGNGHGAAFLWLRRFLRHDGSLIWHEVWYGVPTRGDRYPDGYVAPSPARFAPSMRRVLREVDGVITGTVQSADNLRQIQGATCPIAIARPLVALGEPPRVRDLRYDRDSVLRFVFVGRLGFGKGVAALLGVWETADLGNAELHFYGSFPDPNTEREVLSLARQANGVFFHGPFRSSELGSILQGADIGLMLSIEEGYGLVALEYMWAGLPFIMTDVGAARELTEGSCDALCIGVSLNELHTGLATMARRVRSNHTSRTRVQARYVAGFEESAATAHQIHLLTTDPAHWESCMWPDCDLQHLRSRFT